MISLLHIKNIGIIDDLTINLGEGFNVLTGETGAGKTLIIGSLEILCGGRFSKEIIRTGETECFVEMSLFLPDKGFENDEIIVSREINKTGRNICKINGRLVSVTELKEFMSRIIDIHGQNDNQSLLNVASHIALLDKYSYKELSKIKEEYRAEFSEYLKVKEELANNYGDDKEKERKLDLLRYELNEIESSNLKEGEEEELLEKRKLIMASEKISKNLSEADSIINESVVDSLSHSIKALEVIEEYNKSYQDILERLRNSFYEIEECGRDLSSENSDISFDEEEVNEVETRLDEINTLKRKYGNDIKEIIEYKNKIKAEIYDIENLEDYILSLKTSIKKYEVNLREKAEKLHSIRVKNALKIEKEINQELTDLEMKNAKFSIDINFDESNNFTKNGLDKVEFLISTNIGEDSKPLAKIASGGEMSRIMLSIKNVLSEVDEIPIMIFDEIDTGISGIAANKTGEKIKKIALNHQVICVTHLASIAAKGDHNYYIYKDVENNKTRTNIKELNEQEVLEELARITSGNITDISLKHAKELRKSKLKIA